MMISVGRIINYLDHEEEEETIKEKETLESLDFYNDIEYPICVENVTLKYGKREVLSNLNFKVRARGRVGIYGASGSGKHSIMNLLLGIFKHNEGHLTVFGKPIQKVSKKEIRELCFYVDQTPTLFAGTVRENIDPNYKYTNSELIKVLAYLGFYDLIKINTASFKDMKEWEMIQRDANCKMTLMVNLANYL
jgi:ABC-type multidrug transport system fused ATPase/permease subunit